MAIGRTDYSERKDVRIDRLKESASKAARESAAAIKRSHDFVKDIPLGQPNINGALTGTLNKSRSAADRAIVLNDKAGYYTARAAAAENNGTVSSDDPDAANKLTTQLEKLRDEQEFMKAVNKHWRKNKTMRGFRDITDEGADKINEQMKTAYSWVQKSGPYESWRLSNNNANIKRIEERLAKLLKLDEMPEQEITFNGGTITVDLEENLVKIEFDERQSDDVTAKLKSHGFKWSRNNQCWQRSRTENALWAAKQICEVNKSQEVTNGEKDGCAD